MTTFYFIGGEDHDFTSVGAVSVDTATTAARRTANARCSLVASFGTTNCWVGTLSSPQSSFWMTARAYPPAVAGTADFLSFRDASGVKRLFITSSATGVILKTTNAAGTVTTLATGSAGIGAAKIQKIDVYVNYGTSGTFQLYIDGTLVLSFSGNLVTDSATTLASFGLGATGNASSSFNCLWSEAICCDSDTRFMSLVTLAPVASGNTNNWDVGTVGNINEVTLDDTTVITSGTVGQIAQFTVNSSGVTGTTPIKAVAITARAGKGATGPQTAKFNVRTGAADFSTASVALQAGSVARVQGVFATNPSTGNAWAISDLTAAGFNIGMVSDT